MGGGCSSHGHGPESAPTRAHAAAPRCRAAVQPDPEEREQTSRNIWTAATRSCFRPREAGPAAGSRVTARVGARGPRGRLALITRDLFFVVFYVIAVLGGKKSSGATEERVRACAVGLGRKSHDGLEELREERHIRKGV